MLMGKNGVIFDRRPFRDMIQLHTKCGIFLSFAVMVFPKANVLTGILSEYLQAAVL